MGDDDKLGAFAQGAHIGRVAADVHVVQRRVDLVQHAEGRGAHLDDGEVQGDSHEGLLTARKQGDCPHGLAGQLHLDLDAAVEQIAFVLQLQIGAAAAEDLHKGLLEGLVDLAELGAEDVLHVLGQIANDLEQFGLCRLQIVALGVHELVPLADLGIFLDGVHVDGAQLFDGGPQLADAAVGLGDALQLLLEILCGDPGQFIAFPQLLEDIVLLHLGLGLFVFQTTPLPLQIDELVAHQTVFPVTLLPCALQPQLFVGDGAQALPLGSGLGGVLLCHLFLLGDGLPQFLIALTDGGDDLLLGVQLTLAGCDEGFQLSDTGDRTVAFGAAFCQSDPQVGNLLGQPAGTAFLRRSAAGKLLGILPELGGIAVLGFGLCLQVFLLAVDLGDAGILTVPLLFQLFHPRPQGIQQGGVLLLVRGGLQQGILCPAQLVLCHLRFIGDVVQLLLGGLEGSGCLFHYRSQLFLLLCQTGDLVGTGQHTGVFVQTAAGHSTRRVDQLSVQGDDAEGVAVLLCHLDGAVDMIHHSHAGKQAADDSVILLVVGHKAVCPTGKAGVTALDFIVGAPLLHRRHGQEGGTAEIVGFQIADGALGTLFVVGDDVLHGSAQSDLDGHRKLVFGTDQGGHRAVDAPQLVAGGGLHHPAHRLTKALIFPLHGPQHFQPLGLDLALTGGLLQLLLQLVHLFLTGLRTEGKAPEHILCRGLLVLVFFNIPAQLASLCLFLVQTAFQFFQIGADGGAPGHDLGSAAFQRGNLRPMLVGSILMELRLCLQCSQLVAQIPGAFGSLLHLLQKFFHLLFQLHRLFFQFLQTVLLGAFLLLQALTLILLLGHLLQLGGDIIFVVADVGLSHGDLGAHVVFPVLGLPQLFPHPLAVGIPQMQLLGEGVGLLLQLLGLPLAGRQHPLGVEIVGLGLLQVVLQLFQTVQPDIDLQHTHFVTVNQIGFGPFGLFLQRANLIFQLGDDIPDAHQIFLAGVELALTLLLAVAELGDTGGLFEYLAPVGTLDRQNLVDAALSDDRIAVPSQAGVHEQLMDVLQSDGLAVQEEIALSAAVVPAGDHDLAVFHRQTAVGIVHHQRDLTETQRISPGGTAENNVLHLAAPEGLGTLLTQHPADGIHDVGLAAAIGAHDGGDTPSELHDGLVGKGFKTLYFNGF